MRRVIAWADMQMQLKVYGVCMIQWSGLGVEGSIVGCRRDNVSKWLSMNIVDGYINQIKSIKQKIAKKKTHRKVYSSRPCVIVSGRT